MSPSSRPVALVLHGGAGARKGRDYSPQLAVLERLAREGHDRLASGAPAIEVAVEMVAELEDCGLFVAGRGAAPNELGRYELDASLMHGPDRRAGAVALLEGFRHPIRAARAVMETTPHVFLAGEGANAVAGAQGLERVADPAAWYRSADVEYPDGNVLPGGTVGCVVLDRDGRLAAATSTAGVFNKLPGRIGDCPIIGAGTWADDRVAVSSTGLGEFYIRAHGASQVAARVAFGGEPLSAAAANTLADVASLGGSGGLIAVSREGNAVALHNSSGLKHAIAHADGRITAGVF